MPDQALLPSSLKQFYWIEMNVLQHALQIPFICDMLRPERFFEHVSDVHFLHVVIHTVACSEFLHEGTDAAIPVLLQKEVKMIWHDGIGSEVDQLPAPV